MSLGENKCLNLFYFFPPSLSVDVLVLLLIALICKTIPLSLLWDLICQQEEM